MAVRFIDRAWNFLQREKRRKRLGAYADTLADPVALTIPVPAAATGYNFDASAWLPATVASLTAHTAAGSATATVRIDGAAVTGLTNITITTTPATYTATGANAVAPGNRVTLDILTVSGASGVTAALTRAAS